MKSMCCRAVVSKSPPSRVADDGGYQRAGAERQLGSSSGYSVGSSLNRGSASLRGSNLQPGCDAERELALTSEKNLAKKGHVSGSDGGTIQPTDGRNAPLW